MKIILQKITGSFLILPFSNKYSYGKSKNKADELPKVGKRCQMLEKQVYLNKNEYIYILKAFRGD